MGISRILVTPAALLFAALGLGSRGRAQSIEFRIKTLRKAQKEALIAEERPVRTAGRNRGIEA